MRGTGIEKDIEICITNLANKTRRMSTNANKLKTSCGDFCEKSCKYKNGLGNAHPAICEEM
jgi:hypothetical protein